MLKGGLVWELELSASEPSIVCIHIHCTSWLNMVMDLTFRLSTSSFEKGLPSPFHTGKREVTKHSKIIGQRWTNYGHGSNPAHHLLLYSLQAKNALYIFKWLGGGIKRRLIFHGIRNYMKFKFQRSQHRHSHHLWMDYDRFCAATTELSSYNRDCVACKAPNIFHLALYWRSLMAAVISPRSAITIRIKQGN